MRLLRIALPALALLGLTPGRSLAAESWHTYTNAAGTRQYLLETPTRMPAHPAIVVFLHGCNQTASEVAHGAGWAQLAERRHFVAVLPQEPTRPSDTLLKGCWDWTSSANQHRGSGEPSILAGITEQVMAAVHADYRRTYIAGFSAGGYMANILAVAYPDLYAAAGIVAGGPYGTGTSAPPDMTGQAIVDEMGPRQRIVPVIVVQATGDNVNPYPAGQAAVQQWLAADNLIEGGGVSRLPAATDTHVPGGAPHPGSPTVCDTLAPCLGGLLGLSSYPYTIAHYVDPKRRPLVDQWTIEGANHDYTGATGTFMDPTGPSTTRAVYGFLSAH